MNRRVGRTQLQWTSCATVSGHCPGTELGRLSLSSLDRARYGTGEHHLQARGAERRPLEPPRSASWTSHFFHLPSSGTCSVHPSSPPIPILHPPSQTSPAPRGLGPGSLSETTGLDNDTNSHTRLATRQRQSRLMARQQQARRPEDQQTNQCESWLGRPIRVGWLDGHLHFTRGGCCGAVCGFCGSRPLVRWFWFPPRPRHQPRGETTNTTGTVAAADEHTSPAKLPCRRAVGSSRQVAVIVPTGPRIEADAANFIVARLA